MKDRDTLRLLPFVSRRSLAVALMAGPMLGLLLTATPAAAQSGKNREEKNQTEPKREERREERRDDRPTVIYTEPVIVTSPSPSPRPYPNPAPGNSARYRARSVAPRIAFTSDRDGDPEIYIMFENGAELQRLTRRQGLDYGVTFSPERGRLAYIAAPPGKEFGTISFMNANASRPARLTPMTAREAKFPAWSPDDSLLAFVSEKDGNAEIYVTDPGGRNVRRLTTHPATDTEPTFSPDGQYLLFVSDRDGIRALYRMRVDGSGGVKRLSPPDLGPVATPTYSPDGRDIAFVITSPANPELTDIYMMTADGKSLRQMTKDAGKNQHPVFNPDSDRIAFSSNRNGLFSIYRLDVATGKVTQMTFGPGNDTHPSWW
jgi:Tol biopolymer transport system component